jgi:pimeloyl-ACP methyl ester carboxylesterase
MNLLLCVEKRTFKKRMAIHTGTPIALLHGLGASSLGMLPLAWYLQNRGFQRVVALDYDPNGQSAGASAIQVSRLLHVHGFKLHEPLIIIGHSMGGVVGNQLHKHGWKLAHAIYIGSPLHGARALHTVRALLPTWLTAAIWRSSYTELAAKGRERAPPHRFFTISLGWGASRFDGCVWSDEAVLDPCRHAHLAWTDHRTALCSPTLWHMVLQELVK